MRNKYIALLASTAFIFSTAGAWAQSAPPAIYVTSARTLTNNQTTPLFTDVNGNLKITGTLTGFASTPTFNCGTGCYPTTQPISQAAGSVVSGAYLSGSFADGAIATLGTQADAAWTSGNGTGISLLKAMATSLSGIAAGTAASSTLPIYGQATTAAPSYSNNTPNPLSLDANGNLRVNVVTGGGGGGAVYGPTAVGSAAANPPVLSAGTSNATATGTVQVEKVDSSGNQYVVLSTGANAIGSITNTSFAATESGTWTVQPGNTANTTPWLARISDGTNAAAIKAASTAAAATDPALVVSLSPNTTPVANASAFLNDANATATQIVALSGTTKIYVSAYSIVASVAENVKFQVGTGTNCGTNTADATANMAFAANGGIAAGSGVAPLFIVPAGYALCVTASTTGPTAVNVSYSQF